MDLLILGAGMGVVGGLLPNALQMIALTQVALGKWPRALFVLLVPPLLVDGAFLVMTLFFFRFVPLGIVPFVAYAGGFVLIGFAGTTLWRIRRQTPQQVASSASYTFAGVAIAALAEAAAPGTWIYWLTIAGPIVAEGRLHGYVRVLPFFAGGLLGYYGAAVFATGAIAWGASLHKSLKHRLILGANVLLLLMGISYLVRAYLKK